MFWIAKFDIGVKDQGQIYIRVKAGCMNCKANYSPGTTLTL